MRESSPGKLLEVLGGGALRLGCAPQGEGPQKRGRRVFQPAAEPNPSTEGGWGFAVGLLEARLAPLVP
eukprot:291414-Alexandrium_andersonii.AAC.1